MKRRKPLRAKANLRPKTPNSLRRGRIKPKRRPKAETERVMGSEDFKRFIQLSPCMVCGVTGYSVRAHVCGNGGLSKKKDWTTIAPLCDVRPKLTAQDGARDGSLYVGCHSLVDNHKMEIDGPKFAALTQQRFRAEQRDAPTEDWI